METSLDCAHIDMSKSQCISHLYEVIKRQVKTGVGERLILCCNSITLNDMFEKIIEETGIKNGMTIGVGICLKIADADIFLLVDVKKMQLKTSAPKNKVIHWKWNGSKNEYFYINTECYSCSTAKYVYYPNLLQTPSPVTKKGSRKIQKVSHLFFL